MSGYLLRLSIYSYWCIYDARFVCTLLGTVLVVNGLFFTFTQLCVLYLVFKYKYNVAVPAPLVIIKPFICSVNDHNM